MPTENRSSNTELSKIVTEALVSMVSGVTDMSPPTNAPLPGFIQDPIDRAVERISALLDQPAEQHHSGVAVSIPSGYCLMPRRLTAENGAKALLLGEFKLEVTRECPECIDLEEPAEGCEICDGEGEYAQRHTIPWEQIKFIYSEAVKGLAIQPNAVR